MRGKLKTGDTPDSCIAAILAALLSYCAVVNAAQGRLEAGDTPDSCIAAILAALLSYCAVVNAEQGRLEAGDTKSGMTRRACCTSMIMSPVRLDKNVP
jgi:hypothetical protein